jgi:hypothetical protein
VDPVFPEVPLLVLLPLPVPPAAPVLPLVQPWLLPPSALLEPPPVLCPLESAPPLLLPVLPVPIELLPAPAPVPAPADEPDCANAGAAARPSANADASASFVSPNRMWIFPLITIAASVRRVPNGRVRAWLARAAFTRGGDSPNSLAPRHQQSISADWGHRAAAGRA